MTTIKHSDLIRLVKERMEGMHDYIDRKQLNHMQYLITEVERGKDAADKLQLILQE